MRRPKPKRLKKAERKAGEEGELASDLEDEGAEALEDGAVEAEPVEAEPVEPEPVEAELQR